MKPNPGKPFTHHLMKPPSLPLSLPSISLLLLFFGSCAQTTTNTTNTISSSTALPTPPNHTNEKQVNPQTFSGHQDSSTALVDQKWTAILPAGQQISTRIIAPPSYERIPATGHSFAEYLRHLPLKPHGSEVMLYDGSVKTNNDIYDAVINMKIGSKNLHQCADAVMRFKAEYLWNTKQYDKIHFNLTNGFRVDYKNWMQGQRVVVKGNHTFWKNKHAPSNTYEDFWKYMELIFSYAGTLSLSKELVPVQIKDMKIGDVFIRGGSPGHAVLVIDMAENPITHDKVFLLAQSYMPAQETQILKNPSNSSISPWYSLKEMTEAAELDQPLITPEWSFEKNQLTRFQE